jgi:diaminopimelate epimerase
MAVQSLSYSKYSGIGNTFIIVDAMSLELPFSDLAPQIMAYCRPPNGSGADGFIFAIPSDCADLQMLIFNADGSVPEMCGNGIRCLAQFAYDRGLVTASQLSIETGAGIREVCREKHNQISVDMGMPIVTREKIPMTGSPGTRVVNEPIQVGEHQVHITAVSMGNPHIVMFDQPLDDETVTQLGSALEVHERFPNRINVEFVAVLSRKMARMRVWERGVGETNACGTGACAVLVAGVLTDRMDREGTIVLPGGQLTIKWCEQSGHIRMTGPAEVCDSGTLMFEWD